MVTCNDNNLSDANLLQSPMDDQETITSDNTNVNDKLHDLNLGDTESIADVSGENTQDADDNDEKNCDPIKGKLEKVFVSLIGNIDEHVCELTKSQSELDRELNDLLSKLDCIKLDDSLTHQITTNAKRIANLKSRMTVCHNILNNSSDRCNRILISASSLKPNDTTSTSETNQTN